jgi:threonine dehydrogenase-like Zn-dependent dehydrogenase
VKAHGLVFDASLPRVAVAGALSRLRPGSLARLASPLALREVEVPQSLGPDWVLLEPRFVGVCGSDLMQAQLKADGDNPLSGLVSFPHVMGHEIVAQAAADSSWVVVDPWLGCVARGQDCCPSCAEGLPALCDHAGEPVVPGLTGGGMHLGNVRGLPGGFATAMVAHRSQCRPLPAGLEPRAAVLADPLAVGLHAVERSAYSGQGLALVLGAGTIGLCATAVLRTLDPQAEVLVTAAWPHLAERARELGATPIGTSSRAVTDAVAERTGARRVQPWLGPPWLVGGGASIVIDAVGSAQTAEIAMRAVRPRGRVVRVGVGRAARLQATLAYYKEIEVVGSNGSRTGDLDRALKLLAEGSVPHGSWLTHSFPLAEWRRAFETAGRPQRTAAVKVTLLPRRLKEEVDRLC